MQSRSLLSFDASLPTNMSRPPWQSDFPVPPRKMDGLLGAPPINQRTDDYGYDQNSSRDSRYNDIQRGPVNAGNNVQNDRFMGDSNSNRGNHQDFWKDGILDQQPPRGFRDSHVPSRDFRAGNGILDQGRNGILDQGRSGILDQGRTGILDQGRNRILDQGRNGILDQGRNGILDQGRNRILDQGRNGILDQGRNGILDQGRNGILNQPASLMNQPPGLMNQSLGGGILDSPRQPPRDFKSGDGILSESPNMHRRTFRAGGNGILDQAPPIDFRGQQQELPSLLGNPIAPPQNMARNDFRANTQESNNRGGNTNRKQSLENNSQRRKSNQGQKKDPKQTETSLEKKAMEADLTSEFFDRVKPLSLMQLAVDVSLEFARKEIHERRGGKSSLLDKSFVAGSVTCSVCKVNFPSRMKMNDHYKTQTHKEVEDLFKLKKEQARLIIQKKITRPNIQSKDMDLKSDMIAISRAEVEMELKPKEMDLDPYILGIYESIMKPYWPNPSSSFYCRVCNYLEFKNDRDFKKHNESTEHKQRENTYDIAFCLYCQIHNGSVSNMEQHNDSETHSKIKDLMDRSKQCAINHWHKLNNLEVPEKYRNVYKRKVSEKSAVEPKPEVKATVSKEPVIGSKRSAPDPPDASVKSPTKKLSTEKDKVKSDVAKKIETILSPTGGKAKERKTSSDSSTPRTRGQRKNSEEKEKKKVNEKIVTKADASKDNDLPPRDKVWLIPVTGFMCAACQVFVEENNQKAHVKEFKHNTNVIKFKRQINS